MNVYTTHGAFSWSELTTSDPAAAAAFYGKLFGWTVKEMGPEIGGYRVANIGSDGVPASCRHRPRPRECHRPGVFT